MSAEDERWHVRIAPDEVKVLTLEQVDDLFRLDMIDGNTLLRQEGSSQWLPLRVVAGLDEDEGAPPPPAHSAPPPPPPPLPAPSERTPFAPSPSFAPPPASVRAPSFAPPPPPKPPSLSVAPPASFAPPALSFTPPDAPLVAPARASRAETWLIALVAALGLLVALQRNGVLASLLAATGQAASYAKLEAALGGPGFGTLRAVDVLVAKTPAAAGGAASKR